MKIKAFKIKPGMVIGIDRGDNFGDICLVTSIKRKGLVNIEYLHIDLLMAYHGKLVGSIDRKTKVKVIKGKKRKEVISKIKKEVFKSLHNVEADIDTIRLIEAMEIPVNL